MVKQAKYFIKHLICAAILISLFGCAGLDKISDSEFYPYEQLGSRERYTFKANAAIQYPVDSKEAEQIRMDWLEQWVSGNKLCPNGYSVDSRKPILNNRITRIYYVITCK